MQPHVFPEGQERWLCDMKNWKLWRQIWLMFVLHEVNPTYGKSPLDLAIVYSTSLR